jgi:hypothetical protein
MPKAVLGIQTDILVRIQIRIRTSVPLANGSGSPDPDPTPDPTTFFNDFKDLIKIHFSYFFLISYPQVHHLQSKKFNFLQTFCVKILFFQEFFQSTQHSYGKREGILIRIRIYTSD